jgi:Fur family ferric uptake transcriptional regulator
LFSSNELLDNFSSLWRASIFRTINLFLELWIIRKILLWDRGENYELVNENHHHEHMTCEKCHKIIHFESDSICKDIIKQANNNWFKVKSHSINITWTCEKCL